MRDEAMTRKRLRLVLAAVLLAALAVVLITALPARASHSDGGVDEPWVVAMNQETYWETRFGADCTKYENHSGYIPAQYDIAIIKDGNMVRVYNPAPDNAVASGAVNPANGKHFDAPHSWVMKCYLDEETTTTTTLPDETTTTLPDEPTTTTIPDETTTTIDDTDETTTTTVGLIGVFWDASAECETITVAEWGDGITQVDVWMRDGQFGDFGPADGITPFTAPGSKEANTGSRTEWILIPVTLTGYVAVPDEIHLFTEACVEGSSTTVVTTVTTTPPDGSTLPFTGTDNPAKKAALALSAFLMGLILVTAARGMKEDEETS